MFFLLLFVWSKKNLCSGLSSGSREQRGEPPGSKEFGNVFLSNERVERRKEFGKVEAKMEAKNTK